MTKEGERVRERETTIEELKEAEKGAYEAFKLWKEVPIQQRQVLVMTII